MLYQVVAQKGGSIFERVFWFWETDIKVDQISWTFFEVTTSCSIFRLFLFMKRMPVFYRSFWPFFTSACSGQLTSFKKNSHQSTSLLTLHLIFLANEFQSAMQKKSKEIMLPRTCPWQFLLPWYLESVFMRAKMKVH